ncbi:MAG: hypothetical protein ACRDRH_15395 [Pseudonocardia sp.]
MATALLQPVGDSGISAELTLYESEDGSTLTVLGIATGMRMLGQYLSLACDVDSNADLLPPFTSPGPCVPSNFMVDGSRRENPQTGDLTFRPSFMASTLLGVWKGPLRTGAGTKRTLQVVRPTVAPFGAHLYEMNTVSIHQPSLRLWRNPVHDMRMQHFSLVACGEILRVP